MALVRARHLRVDFIAVHYYQDVTDPAAVSELRDQLIALHRRYHRRLWITEIGAIDLRAWNEPMHATITPAAVASYMRRVFAMLDGLPFVARYAWFTDDCSARAECRYGSLFDAHGRLTAAGSAFQTAP